MTLKALRRDSLLMQDSTPETRQRASKKIAAIRRLFMAQQGADRTAFQCHYCDEWMPRAQMTVDHIVPWSICRITALWNSAFVCQPCNMMKADEIDWCICDRCQFARDRWAEMSVAA